MPVWNSVSSINLSNITSPEVPMTNEYSNMSEPELFAMGIENLSTSEERAKSVFAELVVRRQPVAARNAVLERHFYYDARMHLYNGLHIAAGGENIYPHLDLMGLGEGLHLEKDPAIIMQSCLMAAKYLTNFPAFGNVFNSGNTFDFHPEHIAESHVYIRVSARRDGERSKDYAMRLAREDISRESYRTKKGRFPIIGERLHDSEMLQKEHLRVGIRMADWQSVDGEKRVAVPKINEYSRYIGRLLSIASDIQTEFPYAYKTVSGRYPHLPQDSFLLLESLYDLGLIESPNFTGFVDILLQEVGQSIEGFESVGYDNFAIKDSPIWQSLLDRANALISGGQKVKHENHFVKIDEKEILNKTGINTKVFSSYLRKMKDSGARIVRALDSARRHTVGSNLRAVSTIRDSSIRTGEFINRQQAREVEIANSKKHANEFLQSLYSDISFVANSLIVSFEGKYSDDVFSVNVVKLANEYLNNGSDLPQKSIYLLRQIATGELAESIKHIAKSIHDDPLFRLIGSEFPYDFCDDLDEVFKMSQRVALSRLLVMLGSRNHIEMHLKFVSSESTTENIVIAKGIGSSANNGPRNITIQNLNLSDVGIKPLEYKPINKPGKPVSGLTHVTKLRNRRPSKNFANVAKTALVAGTLVGGVSLAANGINSIVPQNPVIIEAPDMPEGVAKVIAIARDRLSIYGINSEFGLPIFFSSAEIERHIKTRLIGTISFPFSGLEQLGHSRGGLIPYGFYPDIESPMPQAEVFKGGVLSYSDINSNLLLAENDILFALPIGQRGFMPRAGYYISAVVFEGDPLEVKKTPGGGIYYSGPEYGKSIIIHQKPYNEGNNWLDGYSKAEELKDEVGLVYDPKPKLLELDEIISIVPEGEFKNLLSETRAALSQNPQDGRGFIDVINAYFRYINLYRSYSLSFDVESKVPSDYSEYSNLLSIGLNPEAGFYCQIADLAFREFLDLVGIRTESLDGYLPMVSSNEKLTGNVYSRLSHVVTKTYLPDGRVYMLDTTPPITNQTEQSDIETVTVDPASVTKYSVLDRSIIAKFKSSEISEFLSIYGINMGLPLAALIFGVWANKKMRGKEAFDVVETAKHAKKLEDLPDPVKIIMDMKKNGLSDSQVIAITSVLDFAVCEPNSGQAERAIKSLALIPRESIGLVKHFSDLEDDPLKFSIDNVLSAGVASVIEYLEKAFRDHSEIRGLFPDTLKDDLTKLVAGSIDIEHMSESSLAIFDVLAIVYKTTLIRNINARVKQMADKLSENVGETVNQIRDNTAIEPKVLSSIVDEVLKSKGINRQNRQYLMYLKRFVS